MIDNEFNKKELINIEQYALGEMLKCNPGSEQRKFYLIIATKCAELQRIKKLEE
jgi:hypothetical protein